MTPNMGYLEEEIAGGAASGAYNCCVECMKRPRCFSSRTSSNSTCLHYMSQGTSNVCPNGQVIWADYYSYSDGPVGYTYANGPCGTMNNDGVF